MGVWSSVSGIRCWIANVLTPGRPDLIDAFLCVDPDASRVSNTRAAGGRNNYPFWIKFRDTRSMYFSE